MKVDLIKYMSDRLQEQRKAEQTPGPVVTISRLHGCPAKKVATQLAMALNQRAEDKTQSKPWKWISKEIMDESAKVLQVDPEEIKHIFEYEPKSAFGEILSAHFNKYYKSDRKIRNTIKKVVNNIAYEGNVIIVGRGAVAITHHFEQSLHIHLEAPLEWRALRISETKNISIEEARELAEDIDLKRKQFREYYAGKDTDYNWFDVTFNSMTLSVEEIVETILKMLELRKFID